MEDPAEYIPGPSQNDLPVDELNCEPLNPPNSDPDQNLIECMRYTQRDPLGSMLLKIAQDTQELAKRNNIKEQLQISIPELCINFCNAMKLQRKRVDRKLQETNELVQVNMITNEINSHKINQLIEAPTEFSRGSVLTTPAKLTECLKLWPSRNYKFTGDEKKSSVSVIEFLTTMNACQKQLKLSKQEFLERLLGSTSGEAFLLLQQWIAADEPVDAIYHNLVMLYDKRVTSETAKQTLIKYKAPKTSTLAQVEAHIMTLATRIASAAPAGDSRTSTYNMEAVQALIRALPTYSSSQVQNLYNTISAKFKRLATMAELSKALNVYRHTIDIDIKNNGVFETQKSKKYPFGANNNNNKYQNKYQTHATTASYNFRTNKFQRKSNAQPRTVAYISRDNNDNRPYNTRRPNNNNRTSYQNNSRNTYNNYNSRSSSSCTLCGHSTHRASNCTNMVDDQGKQIKIIPTHGVCSLCETSSRKLRHPKILCPFRKTHGPLAKKQ